MDSVRLTNMELEYLKSIRLRHGPLHKCCSWEKCESKRNHRCFREHWLPKEDQFPRHLWRAHINDILTDYRNCHGIQIQLNLHNYYYNSNDYSNLWRKENGSSLIVDNNNNPRIVNVTPTSIESTVTVIKDYDRTITIDDVTLKGVDTTVTKEQVAEINFNPHSLVSIMRVTATNSKGDHVEVELLGPSSFSTSVLPNTTNVRFIVKGDEKPSDMLWLRLTIVDTDVYRSIGTRNTISALPELKMTSSEYNNASMQYIIDLLQVKAYSNKDKIPLQVEVLEPSELPKITSWPTTFKIRFGIVNEDITTESKIRWWLNDIGLSHGNHGHTNDLSHDRLFINKLDVNGQQEDGSIHVYFTSENWKDRKIRISKLVDKDVFHDFMDEAGKGSHGHYYHVRWFILCNHNIK
jgi:hypothetical protein